MRYMNHIPRLWFHVLPLYHFRVTFYHVDLDSTAALLVTGIKIRKYE